MKKLISFFTALAIIFSLCGCGAENKNTASGYTFTDDLGRTVTVSSTDRVASLLGSFTDMWLLAGGNVCASADDAWDDFGLELDSSVENLGSTHKPDKEGLIAVSPTFVLASSKLSKHLEMQETLDGMNIPVAYFDVGDFDDYLRVLNIMTKLTGKSKNYDIYGTQQKDKIDSVIKKHENDKKQTVLVMRASAANIRAKNSDGTMLGGMLTDFGCKNIADSDSMMLENLNIESILLENPDKIFFIETGDDGIDSIKKAVKDMFDENPLWYNLDAVKNNKVYYMDKALYNLKPNARFAEAYENLEKILYEE